MSTPPPVPGNYPAHPAGRPYDAPPQHNPYAQPPLQPGPYGQPPLQPNPYGPSAGHGQAAPSYGYGQPTCRMCGAFPAVNTTIRRHQGVIMLMRFIRLHGPFCRTCGIAVFRDMTTKTLWQGWWSPLSLVIFNPFAIINNLTARAQIAKLLPPAPGQPGPQPDPGPPVTRRPAALVVVLPILWAVWVIANLVTRG